LALLTDLKFSHNTIDNNTVVIPERVYEWAQTKIELENAQARDAAVVTAISKSLLKT
jgi:hypothetical protein